MANRLTLEAVVVAGEDQVSASLAQSAESDVVLLDLKEGVYYELTGVGARIWELIQHPGSIGAILATLLEEFEVGPKQCEEDLIALLGEMTKRGLVEVQEPSGP